MTSVAQQTRLSGTTVAAALGAGARELELAQVDAPERDARLLLAHALGVPAAALVGRGREALTADEMRQFSASITRRRAREPMSHILGRREFWSLDFAVGPDVLTPRPESETVVESALARVATRRNGPLKLLDLGCGSGCLIVALLSELPFAAGVAVDKSESALALARANAAKAGVAGRMRFVCSDWAEALSERFNVILSNPPYIATSELETLMPEVRDFEPKLALDGGADGLFAYRRLLDRVMRLLRPGGSLHLEVGQGQADAVAEIAGAQGLSLLSRKQDLAGIERCLSFTIAPLPEKGLGESLPAA